jgi:hypothetical protein
MDTAALKSKKADAWRERIAAQRASGQPVRQWCRRNAGPIPFAEAIVRAAAQPLCLRLIGGRELVVPASMPVEQVAKLIRLVEGLS